MPWKEADIMSLRMEFVQAAQEEGANMSALCRVYGISRTTGYTWLGRYREAGVEGLVDRSRRPHHSPERTPAAVEQLILEGRQRHPTWGGRKLKRWLEDQGDQAMPAPSTITEVLRRHGQLNPVESAKRRAMRRFEKETPNELWQIDFKGDFLTTSGQRHQQHPLARSGQRTFHLTVEADQLLTQEGILQDEFGLAARQIRHDVGGQRIVGWLDQAAQVLFDSV